MQGDNRKELYPTARQLGTIGKSYGKSAKYRPISKIAVQDGENKGGRPNTQLEITDQENALVILNIKEASVISLVKLLLSRVPTISIATDDELLKMVNDAVDKGEHDAKMVIECIKNRSNNAN